MKTPWSPWVSIRAEELGEKSSSKGEWWEHWADGQSLARPAIGWNFLSLTLNWRPFPNSSVVAKKWKWPFTPWCPPTLPDFEIRKRNEEHCYLSKRQRHAAFSQTTVQDRGLCLWRLRHLTTQAWKASLPIPSSATGRTASPCCLFETLHCTYVLCVCTAC
jgi:hypothetical protein